jgi:hypothetical protein
LDAAFLFLEKPPMSFMYEDVSKITFDRNQSQQKAIKSHSFDFKIKLANGKSQVSSLLPPRPSRLPSCLWRPVERWAP